MIAPEKPFKIYKSSAGSGKTYTLVLSYLTIILKDADLDKFKKILAITFTNKASKEMKERILEGLEKLSSGADAKFTDAYTKATHLSKEKLEEKSKNLLKRILHNYGQLNILTIDKFVHKIIRAFSRELGLTSNFELETNVDEFINRCINELLESVGDDPQLTETLITYSQSLVDDDQLQGIEYVLENQAKLLKTDEGEAALEIYKEKTLEDFKEIQKNLTSEKKQIRVELKAQSKHIREMLSGFDADELKFGNTKSFGITMKSIENDDKNIDYTSAQLNNAKAENWLAKGKQKSDPNFYNHVEGISKALSEAFIQLYDLIKKESLFHEVSKKLVGFSLLNSIRQLLDKIKKENNIIFISDFNDIISDVIKNEPTPFIYEKMGSRYSHYFIDEFQDTSVLQWNNLVPLIHDSLATQNQNLIVGDAKQSIYRWRGGDAKQFIELPNVSGAIADIEFINQSFNLNGEVKSLQDNYRSTESIIDFNNWFFKELITNLSDFPMITEIYKDVSQNKIKKEVGYVKVQVYTSSNNEDDEELENNPLEILLNNINECKEDHIPLGDICILVRSNNHGVKVANFLNENDIDVTSQDSLLLSESQTVKSIISYITLLHQPNDENMLKAFYNNHSGNSIIELFEKYRIPNEASPFFNVGFQWEQFIKDQLPEFDLPYFQTLSIFDRIDYLIPQLGFSRKDIFIDKLLNLTYDFQQRNGHGTGYFLEYFETQKKKVSVAPPETKNAVRIMTIHKSKGLQFPVVMLPLDLISTQSDAIWVQEKRLDKIGLSNFAIQLKEGIITEELEPQNHFATELKKLDDTNILYVALTRPETRLYLSLIEPKNKKNVELPKHLYAIIQNHSNYDNANKTLEIGTRVQLEKPEEAIATSIKDETLQYTNWRKKLKLSLTPRAQQEDFETYLEFEWGKVIHEILQNTNSPKNVNASLQKFLLKNLEWQSHEKELCHIFDAFEKNKEVIQLFENGIHYLSERAIIDEEGIEIRPDKIIEKENEIILIDFKTGVPKEKHKTQISHYQKTLSKIYTKPIQMYLIYLSSDKTEVIHV